MAQTAQTLSTTEITALQPQSTACPVPAPERTHGPSGPMLRLVTDEMIQDEVTRILSEHPGFTPVDEDELQFDRQCQARHDAAMERSDVGFTACTLVGGFFLPTWFTAVPTLWGWLWSDAMSMTSLLGL